MSHHNTSPEGSPPPGTQPPPIITKGIEPSKITKDAIIALRSQNFLSADTTPSHETLAAILANIASNLNKAVDIPQARTSIRHVANIIQHLGHQKINAQAISNTIQAVSTKITADLTSISDGLRTNAKLLEATATNYSRITHDAVEINKNLSDTCSKLTQTTTSLSPSGTRPSYSQVAATQPKTQDSLAQKIQNKQGIQHRQFVISFSPGATDLPTDSSDATNAQIKAKFNEALLKATEGTAAKAEARSANVLSNGRILIELKDAETARWLREGDNRETIAKLFHPDCFFIARPYPLIFRFVPVTFNPTSDEALRDLEAAHDLPANSITGASWIKDPARRSSTQTVANMKINCSSPEAANKLLTSSVRIGHKVVNVQKETKEPTRCNKCQLYGHFAADCKAEKDVCGNCGNEHRTSTCNQEDWWCTPCAVATHPSTSRKCPQFTRRLGILNTRNPEYALPFYQTSEEWTWEQPQPPKPFPRQQSPDTTRSRTKANPPQGSQRNRGRLQQSKLNFAAFAPQHPNAIPVQQPHWGPGSFTGDWEDEEQMTPKAPATSLPAHHHASRAHLMSVSPSSSSPCVPPNLEGDPIAALWANPAPSTQPSTRSSPFVTPQSSHATLPPANANA
jgi:hypothetical protein